MSEVGYKRPPRHSRWKKGQSGNPTGHKKGQRNLATDLADELANVIQVTEGGRPVKLTRQRALVKGLVARAITGDARAVAELLKLIARLADNEPAAPDTTPSSDDEKIIAAFLARHGQKGNDND